MGTEVQPRRVNSGGYTTSVPIFLAVMLCLTSSPARADSLFSEDWPYKEIGGTTLAIGGLGGLSTSLVAFIDIGQNKKPSKLALSVSGIFGVFNSVAGIGYLASSDSDIAVGVGVTHLVLGVVGLGAAIWGSQIPDETKMVVSPVVIAPAPGADSATFGLVVSGRF